MCFAANRDHLPEGGQYCRRHTYGDEDGDLSDSASDSGSGIETVFNEDSEVILGRTRSHSVASSHDEQAATDATERIFGLYVFDDDGYQRALAAGPNVRVHTNWGGDYWTNRDLVSAFPDVPTNDGSQAAEDITGDSDGHDDAGSTSGSADDAASHADDPDWFDTGAADDVDDSVSEADVLFVNDRSNESNYEDLSGWHTIADDMMNDGTQEGGDGARTDNQDDSAASGDAGDADDAGDDGHDSDDQDDGTASDDGGDAHEETEPEDSEHEDSGDESQSEHSSNHSATESESEDESEEEGSDDEDGPPPGPPPPPPPGPKKRKRDADSDDDHDPEQYMVPKDRYKYPEGWNKNKRPCMGYPSLGY